MGIDIWDTCFGNKHIKEIKETAWRMVELQEKTSTRKLVDSLEEQQILDEIIEQSKPSVPANYLKFHTLLYTPLRYPPLKHGSRFGKKTESSIWYGSTKIETAIAEKAYYQLSFLRGSTAEFKNVSLGFTAFSANLKTSRGIKLTDNPFLKYRKQVSSPNNYEASQFLGSRMRENKIDAFTFYSARDPHEGINIGLFNVNVFVEKNPNKDSFQTWQCNATKNIIDFVKINPMEEKSLSFPAKLFFE